MIEVHQYRKTGIIQARVLTHQDVLERQGIIQTLEGEATFTEGDYLCIGIKGEAYPQPKASFEAHNERVGPSTLEGFDTYRSKTPCVAFPFPDTFQVTQKNGDVLTGQPNDYLVIRGTEAWPVARVIFFKTYEKI